MRTSVDYEGLFIKTVPVMTRYFTM